MDTRSDRLRRLGIAGWLWILLLAGVQGQPAAPDNTWRLPDAPAHLRPAITRAEAVITAMHDSLLWELNNGLEQGGATLAIKSCHVDAMRIAQKIGREEGIAAGRTGDRLRNPTNAPRPWAAPLVRANAGRPVKDVDGFVVDLGGKVGVMKPIAELPRCAACHGDPGQFSAAVRAELKDRYPVDHAVGFKDGEVRGWYWVEIPK